MEFDYYNHIFEINLQFLIVINAEDNYELM